MFYYVFSDINRGHPTHNSCEGSLKEAVNTAFLMFIPLFYIVSGIALVGLIANNFVIVYSILYGDKDNPTDFNETVMDDN